MFWIFFSSLLDHIPDFIIQAFKQISKSELEFVSLRESVSQTIPFYFIEAFWIDFILYFNN